MNMYKVCKSESPPLPGRFWSHFPGLTTIAWSIDIQIFYAHLKLFRLPPNTHNLVLEIKIKLFIYIHNLLVFAFS